MNTKKYTINFLIEFKCLNCEDKKNCKIKKHYKTLENPTNSDIEKLNNCLFYKITLLEKRLLKITS